MSNLKTFFVVLLLVACSSTSKKQIGETTFSDGSNEAEYEDLVERYMQSASLYDGFYNIMQFKAIMLNSVITEAQLYRDRQFQEWTPSQYEKEREKRLQEMSNQTKIFLSFYVPNRQHDNLSYNNSVWKIFLDSNGRRFEAKAVKISKVLAEVQSLYPFHSRWSTPYFLTFNIPVTTVQESEATLTITGPVGSLKVKFNKLDRTNK